MCVVKCTCLRNESTIASMHTPVVTLCEGMHMQVVLMDRYACLYEYTVLQYTTHSRTVACTHNHTDIHSLPHHGSYRACTWTIFLLVHVHSAQTWAHWPSIHDFEIKIKIPIKNTQRATCTQERHTTSHCCWCVCPERLRDVHAWVYSYIEWVDPSLLKTFECRQNKRWLKYAFSHMQPLEACTMHTVNRMCMLNYIDG